jgi:hypothetical protein
MRGIFRRQAAASFEGQQLIRLSLVSFFDLDRVNTV